MNAHLQCLLLLVVLSLPLSAQIIINEVQSANESTLFDEFGETPDWIELKNTSDSTVSLHNWYLSDSRSDLKKWAFPNTKIQANGYLLVYASGRDIKQTELNWNTIIDLGDDWQYMVPTQTVSGDWVSNDYNDDSWKTGISSFGYDKNDNNTDDSTILAIGTISVYLRHSFVVEDTSIIKSALLHMDYDDGFVAYLNGTEVSRENIGIANSKVNYNDLATLNHEGVVSEAIIPESFDISQHINLLKEGTNVLAVEVHNKNNTSSDLTAIPFLSFAQTSFQNSHESQFLGLGGNKASHSNFKISASGESLYISSPDSIISDSIEAPALPANTSFGTISGSNEKKHFTTPTPGLPNGNIGLNNLAVDSVFFSRKSHFITTHINLELASAGEHTIYYTTDNSEPTLTSKRYNGAFTIDSTTTIRARIIKDGYLPSMIYAHTYLKERQPNLPVITLSTDHANLWDYNTGMYALGPNAEDAHPRKGANFWMDWEYPFSFVYLDKEGTCQLSQQVGAKIFGAWSRARAQKSFSIFARNKYGNDLLDYPLFEEQTLNSFSSIVLRNSGNDWIKAKMRDGLITTLTSHLGVEHQAYQPTVTYLNGEYWGIYNMREKINEHFLAAHHSIEADEVIMLQNTSNVENTNDDYGNLIAFLNTSSSLQSTDNYNKVIDEIDIDNYIKYQLIQIYIGNTDWPGNNNKFWKTTNPNSKWRWILYDTDFGFKNATANTLEWALATDGTKIQNSPWATLLFRRLVSNNAFRNDFINQMADNINTTFSEQAVHPCVDSLYTIVEKEMPYHCEKWEFDFEEWKGHVADLKTFADNRPTNVREHIQDYFSLQNQHPITLEVSDKAHGSIKLNSIIPSIYPFSGIFFEGVPVTIKALPKVGYRFIKWEGDHNSSDLTLAVNLTSNTNLKAIFEKDNSERLPVVINEINYKSHDKFDAGDWIELFNPNLSPIDLSGFVFKEEYSDRHFAIPNGTLLGAQSYLVIAQNKSKFKSLYPEVNNIIGDFTFGLNANGDPLRLENEINEPIDTVNYESSRPWPEGANGTGYTIELINAAYDNNDGKKWQSNTLKGTPGRENTYTEEILGIRNITATPSVSIFPTKFSDFVSINIDLVEQSDVNIDIVSTQGKIVHQIRDTGLPSGEYLVDWTPNTSTANGIYIVRVQCNNTVMSSKVIYLP